MSGGSLRSTSPVQPDIVVASTSPLFGDQNGPSFHHNMNGQAENGSDRRHRGRSLKLRVEIRVNNNKGGGVTRFITSSDKSVPTLSTDVVSPEGAKDGATARPNYSAKLSSRPTGNSERCVLGRITIGGVKKDGSNQVDKIAAGGKRYLHEEQCRERLRREKLRLEQELRELEEERWWWCNIF